MQKVELKIKQKICFYYVAAEGKVMERKGINY